MKIDDFEKVSYAAMKKNLAFKIVEYGIRIFSIELIAQTINTQTEQ